MPVAARPDVVAAVVARLRSFTELTDLCGTNPVRITARSQPSWSGMPTYAILARPAGEPIYKPELPILLQRFDVFCYGATESQAAALWRQFDPIFCPGQERSAGFVQGTCRVATVLKESGLRLEVEEGTEWPRAVSTYLVAYLGVAS